jgi:hypothetical protein
MADIAKGVYGYYAADKGRNAGHKDGKHIGA